MAAAAPTLKRVFLELGGKSAAIVLDDGDLGAGAGMAAFSVCMHAGQGCALTTRLVVPRSRYDEAVEIAADTMGTLPFGDPTDPATICGPLINAAAARPGRGLLGVGASRTAAGSPPAAPARRSFDAGFWIDPTVIAGLDNDARAAREEIFGPVLVVIAHDGDDDAVRIANDSPYGLSGVGHLRRSRACASGGRPHPHRHDQRQRRRVVLRGRAVRRLQAVRHRTRDGRGRLRGVPRDQARRRRRLTSCSTELRA